MSFYKYKKLGFLKKVGLSMQINGFQNYTPKLSTNSYNANKRNTSFNGKIIFRDDAIKLIKKEDNAVIKTLTKYLEGCAEDLYIYKQDILGVTLPKLKGYLTTWNGFDDVVIHKQGRQKLFEKPIDFIKRMCIKATPYEK